MLCIIFLIFLAFLVDGKSSQQCTKVCSNSGHQGRFKFCVLQRFVRFFHWTVRSSPYVMVSILFLVLAASCRESSFQNAPAPSREPTTNPRVTNQRKSSPISSASSRSSRTSSTTWCPASSGSRPSSAPWRPRPPASPRPPSRRAAPCSSAFPASTSTRRRSCRAARRSSRWRTSCRRWGPWLLNGTQSCAPGYRLCRRGLTLLPSRSYPADSSIDYRCED